MMWSLIWLVVALFFGVTAAADVPATGLDPSWATAMNLLGELRFGPELVFTYGPWGFLDAPLILSRPLFGLALVVEVAVIASVWIVAYRALVRRWSSWLVAPVSTVVAVVTAPTELSSLALCAAAGGLLLHVVPPDEQPARAVRSSVATTAGLAALGALLLQVKVSDGLAVLALAAVSVVAAASFRQAWIVAAAGVASAAVATAGLWLARCQSLGDLPRWLRGSLDMVTGYGEALSLEAVTSDTGYYAAGAVTLLLVVAALLLLRGRRWSIRVTVVLVLGLVVAFAFKDGFTRHDTFHEPAFFILTGVVLVVVTGMSRHPVVALVGAVLALGMVRPDLTAVDPGPAAQRWKANARVLVDAAYASDRLDSTRTELQRIYALPEPIRRDLSSGAPVSIDPWETTLAWAYDLNWAPVPVFQTYAVLSEDLDERNAEAIAGAPPDQLILRRAEIPNESRNPVWESPRYQLAVACHYATSLRQDPYRLLEHREPRCDAAAELSSLRVDAGQVVEIPVVDDDVIVTATFAPDAASPLTRLRDAALKVYDHLTVTADAGVHRVSRLPTTGPMMVTFPQVEDGAFDAFAYRTLTFSQPGEITFATTRIR